MWKANDFSVSFYETGIKRTKRTIIPTKSELSKVICDRRQLCIGYSSTN